MRGVVVVVSLVVAVVGGAGTNKKFQILKKCQTLNKKT
uniref:Uncharacterized protein n=1 Tax=Ciona intestinalis TaxID=7719 RepID=F6YSV9_CIOIN